MAAPERPVLRGAEAGPARRWEPPQVLSEHVTGRGGTEPATAGHLEGVHRQAYEEGFAQGREAGFRQGHSEGAAAAQQQLRQAAATFEQLAAALAAPLGQLDEEFEQSVADLVALIARQLVRRELRAAQGEVVAVVREAMAQLPIAARNPRIHVHPEDLEILRESLALADTASGWKLQGDPLINRGGCLVETDSSFVDATVEARLNAIIAKAFGGERSSDRDGD